MRIKAAIGLAALALAGCDYLAPDAGGGNATANAAAASGNGQQAQGGGKPGDSPQGLTQTADAGVTTSRSLQAFSGNMGGKSPGPGGTGATIDPQNLVGNWTDTGDCSQVTEIYSDGTFRAANGNTGDWRLDGDVMTFSAGSSSAALRLQSADGESIISLDSNGQLARSTRC